MSSSRLLRSSLPFTALRRPTVSYPRRPSLVPARTFWWSAPPPPLETTLELASNSIPQISLELLPLILAVVLSASNDDEQDPTPPWAIASTSKGFGAFASRPLEMGELLIAERPICVWPQGLSATQAKELFDAMPEKEQKVYQSLARTEGEGPVQALDEVRAIRATNGFAVQVPGGRTVAMVFPKIARINHSCTPNASQVMNFQTLRMEVYPITAISPSTEVCIEYLPLITSIRSERQRALQSSFGFTSCLCALCVAPIEVVEKSDERRREIKSLSEGLRDGRKDRKGTMVKMERIRVLLEEEGYKGLPEFEDVSLSNAYAVYASMHERSRKVADG